LRLHWDLCGSRFYLHLHLDLAWSQALVGAIHFSRLLFLLLLGVQLWRLRNP
jgi:hypothetical protein